MHNSSVYPNCFCSLQINSLQHSKFCYSFVMNALLKRPMQLKPGLITASLAETTKLGPTQRKEYIGSTCQLWVLDADGKILNSSFNQNYRRVGSFGLQRCQSLCD